jgi:protein TonB
MKLKRLLTSLVIGLLASSIFAQLPPQTVTFKVRKSQAEEILAVTSMSENVIEEAFMIVEENATFQGGDLSTFRKWVQQNTVYPTAAAEAGISGKVIVQFAVDEKGNVVDARIMRSVHPELDKEALRILSKSPKWLPGKQSGKAVKQLVTIPVVFSLQ